MFVSRFAGLKFCDFVCCGKLSNVKARNRKRTPLVYTRALCGGLPIKSFSYELLILVRVQ